MKKNNENQEQKGVTGWIDKRLPIFTFMNHNLRDLSSTILPPSLVFTLAIVTGILSKTLLIEKPTEEKCFDSTMQMAGVELIHNKFETKKHTLSIITADSIEYEGKRINFINPNLTSHNGDAD